MWTSQMDVTRPSADRYNVQRPPGLLEEERGKPQRFRFLCQDIGDTATQVMSPGDGDQAQRHHPASLSSESGESLRHVGCYPTVAGKQDSAW